MQNNPMSGREELDRALEMKNRMISDLEAQSEHLASDVRKYYRNASQWVRNNPGKTLSIVGAIAAVGILSFYFLRENDEISDLKFPT